MLIAVAIFAIASVMAYGGLAALTRARADLDAANARLGALQWSIGLIERDLRSAAARAVRDAWGAPHPAFEGDRSRVELTRHGHANRLAHARAELERVAYTLEDGALVRRRQLALDSASASALRRDVLLERVERLEWRFVGEDGREHAQWPPPRAVDDRAPRAVILTLSLPDYGELRRVLELPAGAAP